MIIYITNQQLNDLHRLANECDRSPLRQFDEASWINGVSSILQMEPSALLYRNPQLIVKKEEYEKNT